MSRYAGMRFWVILARDIKKGEKLFEPFNRYHDGKIIAYNSKKDAKDDLSFARDLFGKRNAYLQMMGPIS